MPNRYYQDGQLNAIESNYVKGINRQVISAATGTGKTIVFSQIPERMKKYLPGQTLVLENRNELIDQSIEKLRIANPDLKINKEKADDYADVDSDVIVASVPTLGRKHSKRASRFDKEKIDKLITDECHHAPAESYIRIYEELGVLGETKKLHVGCTATPSNRSDGKGLSEIFQKIVHEYTIRQAIEDGWLVDLKGITVKTKSNLDEVKTKLGDFDEKMLATTVNTPERNQLAVEQWIWYAKDRQTIAFCVDIQHAKDLAKVFQDYGIKAEAIWGDDPDRAKKLKQHKEGKLQVLTNCGILTEGYDDWRIGCILLARPTKSGVLYVQMVGRGTRLDPAYGCLKREEGVYTVLPRKTDCLVMDLVDVSSKHTLVTLPTLMGIRADFDLHGRSLIGAIHTLEEKQEEFPHLDFSDVRELDKLEAYIESVDFFSVKPVPEAEESSEMVWQHSPDGGYIIHLPNKEFIKVHENLLGKWNIKAKLGGKSIHGERVERNEIFSVADELVYKYTPTNLKLVKRTEGWRSKPATLSQIELLRKLFRDKPLPRELDCGTASLIIGRELDKKNKRKYVKKTEHKYYSITRSMYPIF